MAERAASARLSPGELRRYSRHLLIPEVALAGQERLAAARVLVIGAGGLGSPLLQYLAAAGVGRLGIVDFDTVDVTNLQRQTLFRDADIGEPKALVAARAVQALNPHVNVDAIETAFDTGNARELVRLYDVVADCTDRFSTRYLINDACVAEGRPNVAASIFRFDGQLSVYADGDGPCYRCLYPDAPPAGSVPTCAEGGVLGVLAGILGTLQANEILKRLLSVGTTLKGRLLLVDALAPSTTTVAFDRDPACVMCGAAGRRALMPSYDERDEVQPLSDEIDALELEAFLRGATLLDVREPHEAIFGAPEPSVAVPASQLEARLHELDSSRTYVVACRVGVKSRWAVSRLRDAGFTRVRHLRGGLLAYAATTPEFAFF